MAWVVNLDKPGSKMSVIQALKRLGILEEAERFRNASKRELERTGDVVSVARERAWGEMIRLFLPRDEAIRLGVLQEVQPAVPDGAEGGSQGSNGVAESTGPGLDEDPDSIPQLAATDTSFGMLPGSWPALPEKAAWLDELEWAYQNGFFVISVKASGAVTYLWDRARSPAPSYGALVLMKLQAESRQKFMDLLGKAKTSTDAGDTEGVKREKRRIEELEAMLVELNESD